MSGDDESASGAAVAQGGLFARNAAINLVGQAIPLAVALIAIPISVRALGPDRFGVLALTWLVLGSFLLFDFGIGKATAKLSAEAFAARDEERIRYVAWASLLLLTAFGLVGGLVLLLSAEPLVRIVNVPTYLTQEAVDSFTMLAFGLPITLAMLSVRAILEAAQRFDLVNLVSGPSTALTYILSAAGAQAGLGLPSIVALLILNRLAATLAYALVGRRAIGALRYRPQTTRAHLRDLIGYGSWVTVSGLVSPLLIYADRFLIAAFGSVAQLTYYVAPYEMVTRLWIVPVALILTLFPGFSAIGLARPAVLAAVFTRASKYMLFLLGPVVVTLTMVAGHLLSLWLGPEFAARSAQVFRVLLLGALFTSFGFVSLALLQAIGRPDLSAKYHVASLIPFITIAAALIHWYGLIGAAIAWTLRAAVDATMFTVLSTRLVPGLAEAFRRHRFRRIAWTYCVLLGSAFILASVDLASGPAVIATILLASLSIGVIVIALADHEDRAAVRRLVRDYAMGVRVVR